MSDPTLALQKAIGDRLASSPAVTALVPADRIVDAPVRRDDFPAIVFGTAQTVAADLTFSRQHARVFLDLHVWTPKDAHVEAKQIVGAMTAALRTRPSIEDFDLVDYQQTSARFLRDPDGVGHAVVSVEALIGWRT